MFRGTFTAVVTPFRDGGVDDSAFKKLIETQLAAGITGIVAIGTTGESPTLSHDEREHVIRLAVTTANKRCLVLAGTGSNATQHAVADTIMAEKLGVDGALLVAPYYNKPSQEGLFRHFKAIADATSLPMMLYNIPGRCSVDIVPETVVRLAKECGNIVAIGTTGESPTLSHKEREHVIRLAVATANKRCLVLAGTGSNATQHAVADTTTAEKLGVDGALLVAPYYNKPSQEGLFRHFKTIADATSLPIMLYNIPGRCSVDILPETVVRLAKECRNIVSIKEASGSVERVSELRRRLPEPFTILSGDDSLTLPFMAVGAVGVVSVASNLFPSEVCALVRACESGDLKSAAKLHRKLLPLFKDLFIEPNPVPVKTALGWRGAIAGEVRLPLCEMSEANQARLRKTLEDFEQNT